MVTNLDKLNPRCGYCVSFLEEEKVESLPYPHGKCSQHEKKLLDYHFHGVCEFFELKADLIRTYTCAGCRSVGLPHSCFCVRNYSGEKDQFKKQM